MSHNSDKRAYFRLSRKIAVLVQVLQLLVSSQRMQCCTQHLLRSRIESRDLCSMRCCIACRSYNEISNLIHFVARRRWPAEDGISTVLRQENFSTYRTVQHRISLVSPLLDVALQGAGIKRLQKLEATEKLARNRHHGAPIIEFAAVLCRDQ